MSRAIATVSNAPGAAWSGGLRLRLQPALRASSMSCKKRKTSGRSLLMADLEGRPSVLVIPIILMVAVFLLFSIGGVAAGDYVATYAIDIGEKNDAGRIEDCVYEKPCQIVSKGVGLRINLNFSYPDHGRVHLHVYGPPGCCVFSDAVESITLDPKQALQRVVVFEGRERVRNEYVQNRRIGVVYLSFSELQ
jgi:hypothetical protein